MGKRAKFAGGSYDSGDGGSHGYGHREHGHSSTSVWRGRRSEVAAREYRSDIDDLRGLAKVFPFLAGRNRKRQPRRNQ